MSEPETTSSGKQGVSLQVRDVCKSYSGNEVLKDVSFDVEPGEIFVIMGPSGSGKSVLLRHLIGLETIDAGEILIDGHSVDSVELASKYRLAMVFQSGALLNSLTVGENVGLYLSEHRLKPPEEISRIVKEKLELVGLEDVEDKLPSQLSGGMRKRASIARALVIEPQLMFYDEPTSELDPLSAVTISEEILALNQRIHVTSVVVTHDRDMAFGIADRIAVINEGQFIAVDTPDGLRASDDPVIQKFLKADFRMNNRKNSNQGKEQS